MNLLRWTLAPMIVAGVALHAVGAGAEGTSPPDSPATEGKLALGITTKKTEDRVEVETKADTATLTLTSPSGIGTAAISLKQGQWPHKVVLRLRLKGLESFTISNGKVAIGAAVSSHGDQGPRVYRKDGGQEIPVQKSDPHWMEIKVVGGEKAPLKDGYFEVVLPEALLRDGPKTLTVRWIDFYRG